MQSFGAAGINAADIKRAADERAARAAAGADADGSARANPKPKPEPGSSFGNDMKDRRKAMGGGEEGDSTSQQEQRRKEEQKQEEESQKAVKQAVIEQKEKDRKTKIDSIVSPLEQEYDKKNAQIQTLLETAQKNPSAFARDRDMKKAKIEEESFKAEAPTKELYVLTRLEEKKLGAPSDEKILDALVDYQQKILKQDGTIQEAINAAKSKKDKLEAETKAIKAAILKLRGQDKTTAETKEKPKLESIAQQIKSQNALIKLSQVAKKQPAPIPLGAPTTSSSSSPSTVLSPNSNNGLDPKEGIKPLSPKKQEVIRELNNLEAKTGVTIEGIGREIKTLEDENGKEDWDDLVADNTAKIEAKQKDLQKYVDIQAELKTRKVELEKTSLEDRTLGILRDKLQEAFDANDLDTLKKSITDLIPKPAAPKGANGAQGTVPGTGNPNTSSGAGAGSGSGSGAGAGAGAGSGSSSGASSSSGSGLGLGSDLGSGSGSDLGSGLGSARGNTMTPPLTLDVLSKINELRNNLYMTQIETDFLQKLIERVEIGNPQPITIPLEAYDSRLEELQKAFEENGEQDDKDRIFDPQSDFLQSLGAGFIEYNRQLNGKLQLLLNDQKLGWEKKKEGIGAIIDDRESQIEGLEQLLGAFNKSNPLEPKDNLTTEALEELKRFGTVPPNQEQLLELQTLNNGKEVTKQRIAIFEQQYAIEQARTALETLLKRDKQALIDNLFIIARNVQGSSILKTQEGQDIILVLMADLEKLKQEPTNQEKRYQVQEYIGGLEGLKKLKPDDSKEIDSLINNVRTELAAARQAAYANDPFYFFLWTKEQQKAYYARQREANNAQEEEAAEDPSQKQRKEGEEAAEDQDLEEAEEAEKFDRLAQDYLSQIQVYSKLS